MKIKINFEDFKQINKGIEAQGSMETIRHPLMVYENDSIIYFYRPIESLIYCAEVKKEFIKDLVGFKLEFIPKTVLQLIEPLDEDEKKVKVVVTSE